MLDGTVVSARPPRGGASSAGAPATTATAAGRPLPRWLGFRPLLLVAVVLSAASLLLFRAPTFDVWAWLLWGRETAHLDLSTTWGPAFKPLPVAVATVLSPLGGAAPVLWLFLARLGGLLAVGAAARLAYRNAGPVGAVVAAAGLLLVRQYSGYLLPHGMSEPMMVAFLLWGLDRLTDGRRETAFWLGVLAGLLRPEIWPFLLGYALLLMRGRSWPYRARLLAGLVSLPVLWYLPDYLGSGEPFRSGEGVAVPGGPLTQSSPGLGVLRQFPDDVPHVLLLGAVLGLAVALWRRSAQLLGYVGFGAGWLLIVAVMAQLHRSSGVSRYLLPTYALVVVLAGIGWATALQALARHRRSLPTALAAVAALVLGVVVAIGQVPALATGIRDEARELHYQAGLQSALPQAIADAGGPDALRSCGRIWTSQYQVPYVAWTLHEHLDEIWSLQLPGLPQSAYVGPLLQTKDRRDAPVAPVPFDFLTYRPGGSASSNGATWTTLLPADCS